LIAEVCRFLEQAEWAVGEKRVDEFVIGRVKILPYLFKRRLAEVAEDYAAACAAKDIAVRVDVNTFCAKKVGFATR